MRLVVIVASLGPTPILTTLQIVSFCGSNARLHRHLSVAPDRPANDVAFDLRGLCLPGTAAYGNIDFGQILTDGSKQNLGRFEGCVSADGVDP